MRGTVKWFDRVKGYGFITSDDDGNDYFMHYSGINMEGFKCLDSNDIVSFDLKEGSRGMLAVNVTPILTRKMIADALSEYGLFLRPVHVDGCTKYLVVNENNVIQSPEQGMTLLEAAEYAELDVSVIENDPEISDATSIYLKLPKEKQNEIDNLCKYLWEIRKTREIIIFYSDQSAEKIVFEEDIPDINIEYKLKILQTVVTKFMTKGGGMVLRLHSAKSKDVIMGFSCINMGIRCLSVDEIKNAMELQPDGSKVIYDDQEYAMADICF